jgi:hypothetical protein
VSFRPVTDVWILARAKLKDGARFYGAFPAGFLHRARALLGVRLTDPVLHVCGGLVRANLYRGFGPNDKTLDLDPRTKPDYLMDARWIMPGDPPCSPPFESWPAVLIDRPYTLEDHAHYLVAAEAFPRNLNDLLRRCLSAVEVGGRVGVLDYLWPSPPKWAREVAVVAVGTGRNNRARWYTVFERCDAAREARKLEADQP